MPSIQAIADALSTTFTDERYPVGTLYVQTDNQVKSNLTGVSALYTEDNWLGKGERTWIFIKAGTGGIDAGEIVKRVPGADPFVGIPASVADTYAALLLGVADNDIDEGEYGWVIKNGACVFDGTGSGITEGDFVACGGAGGVALEDADEESAAVIGMAAEDLSAVLTNFAQGFVFL